MKDILTPIIGTLGFVISEDKTKTLLVHRTYRQDDAHLGKYNGLGGKMMPEEDVVTCIKREIMEEAGIICQNISLRGTINWTGFGPHNEDWFGFIFRIDTFSGKPYPDNEEGSLGWHKITELHKLPMWEGDQHFLPMVFDNDPRVFHGVMPYKNNRPIGWSYSRI